jgi:CRISPR-associated protein Csy3
MTTETLKTASVLAFERKLDASDALFFSGNWQDRAASANWQPVSIQPKSVRGTISNRLKTKDQDPAKLDAAIENPNLQTVDVATLPHQADTLKVAFTLRVLAGTGQASACNSAEYRQRLEETIQKYAQETRFTELARRYASNLANGRFLWRNRIGAEQVEVHIARLVDGKTAQNWTFDALALSLLDFEAPAAAKPELEELSALIAAGLRGEEHVLLSITAYARIGNGQEVFPSQELILDRGRGDKSKTLYHVKDVAAIHSQKIGNAIRSIDTWYPNAETPIAVEPYGSVTTQGKAYRQPKDKVDFYTLLDNWILKGQAPEPNNQHYVVAVLVRGGVFGEAG